jgi:large repetitive protein
MHADNSGSGRWQAWRRLVAAATVAVTLAASLVLTGIGSVPGAAAGSSCDNFTNAAGGAWTTGSNWSDAAPPTSGQNACIVMATTNPVTLQGATVTAGGLTLGTATTAGTLQLSSGTLDLDSSSVIGGLGVVKQVGGNSTISLASGATLANAGTISSVAALDLSGSVTNTGTITSSAPLSLAGSLSNSGGGSITLTGSSMDLSPNATFTNAGEVLIEQGASVNAPTADGGGPTLFDNAAGTVVNDGSIGVASGGTLQQGAGLISGNVPLVNGGALDLAGTGPGLFELAGTSTLSGTVAADQTIDIYNGTTTINGALVNDGTIVTTDGPTLAIPAGSALDNAGTVLCNADALNINGSVVNQVGASFSVGGPGNCGVNLNAPAKFSNDGAVAVGPNSNITLAVNGTGEVTFDNEGSVANGGNINVGANSAFQEGAGTASGDPVKLSGGALDLTGTGASSFIVTATSTMTGDIAADQVVGLVATVDPTSSFDNYGTINGHGGTIDLPSGGTLTNDGTVNAFSGTNLYLNGNLTNNADGTVDVDGSQLNLDTDGTTFDNAGTLNLLFDGAVYMGNYGGTFDSTGLMNFGVYAGNWGGGGLHSDIEAMAADNGNPGSTVELGGAINPVLASVLPTPPPDGPQKLTFEVVAAGDSDPNGITISCPAGVTGGWALSCTDAGEQAATLTVYSNGTLDPTSTTLTSTAPVGVAGLNYPTTYYGQPVTFTATVSPAVAGAPAPTGQVLFVNQLNSTLAAVVATGTLSTTGGVTTATFTTSSLSPGLQGGNSPDQLLAVYTGDGNSLASSSADLSQLVVPQATTATVGVSPSPSPFGGAATLTATVSPGTTGPAAPSGTVSFYANGGQDFLGSAPVTTTQGVTTAQVTTYWLPAGAGTVTASYSGDVNYAGANYATGDTSPPIEDTVTSGAAAFSTATTATASTSTPIVGQAVTYTATVASVAPVDGTPTGTVTFTGDAGTMCTTSLNEGSPDQATCTTTYGAAGTDAVTASYSGDGAYISSVSGPVQVTIGLAQNETSLQASPTAPVVGDEVDFTATVAQVAPGQGTPTGDVTISGAAGALCTAALNEQSPDQATCSTTYGAVTTDSLTASYVGDGNDQGSTSGAVPLTVGAAATTTSLSSSDANPVVGETVAFVADVSANTPGTGTPTGSVSFVGGAGTLCTATLGGADPDQASCSTTYAAPAADEVTADYQGDGNFSPSVSSPQSESVGEDQTTTLLAAQPAALVVGQPVTYTATVSASAPGSGTPTGVVKISGAGGFRCTAALDLAAMDQANCTTTYTSQQTDSVTATYQGDGNYAGSSSSVLGEPVSPAATSTGLSVDNSSPAIGQTVNFTATVAVASPGAGTPTGEVVFTGDNGTICTATLGTNGAATCATSYGAAGSDSVTATYQGDGNFATSTSSAVAIEVTGAPATNTALTTTDASPVVGEVVTFTATVSATAGTPTGTVTFTSDTGAMCTEPLNGSGQATCTVTYAVPGTGSVTASYTSTDDLAGSQSAAVVETIGPAGTTTELTASSAGSVVGQQVTYTATVAVTSPGSGAPEGLVVFTGKAGRICAVGLDASSPDQARCLTTYSTKGTDTVTASYQGSPSFGGSQSSAVSETVGAAGTTAAVVSSANPSVTGQDVTFTATISTNAPSTATPTGKVVFVVTGAGRRFACTGGGAVTLVSGSANCAVKAGVLSPSYSPLDLIVGYEGASAFNPSSAALNQTISPALTSLALSSSNPSPKPGQSVTFDAAVAAMAPGSGTPKGTVSFSFSPRGSLSCTAGGDNVVLHGGTATCRLAVRTLEAPVEVTATYSGSASYLSSAQSLGQGLDS